MGGLLKMWALPQSDLILSGKTVTFASNPTIYELYCSADSMNEDEPEEHMPAGTFYPVTITAFVPKDTEETREAMVYLERRKLVCIVQNGNGDFKLIGNNVYPMRLSAKLNSGTDTSDRAGYTLTFTGKITTRSIFINDPF